MQVKLSLIHVGTPLSKSELVAPEEQSGAENVDVVVVLPELELPPPPHPRGTSTEREEQRSQGKCQRQGQAAHGER